jgi:cytochrome c551/c552
MTRTKIAVAAAVLLAAIQLVPVSRTNPPVSSALAAPPAVAAVLKRACYDCHSHETTWPLQAWVAPVSWLVAHDVSEGREELNFSAWDRVDRKKVAKKLPEELAEGEMPPWLYVLAHPEARLSDADRKLLVEWARGLAEPRTP